MNDNLPPKHTTNIKSCCISCGVGIILFFLFIWIFFIEHFIYSPGLTETKFSKIRNGMAESEVTRILGEPIFKEIEDDPYDIKTTYKNKREVWNYSKLILGIGFDIHDRKVWIQDGKVVKSEWYDVED